MFSCLEGRKSPDPRRQAQGTRRVQVLPPTVCPWMEDAAPDPACTNQATFQAGGVWARAQRAGFRECVRKSPPRSATSE